jgi:cell wall-associated NlpC family hydrolase
MPTTAVCTQERTIIGQIIRTQIPDIGRLHRAISHFNISSHPPRRTRLRFCLILATALCGCAAAGALYLADPAAASPSQAPQAISVAYTTDLPVQWPEYDDQTPQQDTIEFSPAEAGLSQSYRSSSWDDTSGTGDDGEDTVRPVVTSRGDPRPTTPHAAPSGGADVGNKVVSIAKQYLGFNYAWGGASPRTGFDCSGFTWFVYSEAGLSIPSHNLAGQLAAAPRLSRDQLQPGDLVFFANTYEPGLSHGGIYVGDGSFIHAENENTGVRISPLDTGPWAPKFLAGSRPR